MGSKTSILPWPTAPPAQRDISPWPTSTAAQTTIAPWPEPEPVADTARAAAIQATGEASDRAVREFEAIDPDLRLPTGAEMLEPEAHKVFDASGREIASPVHEIFRNVFPQHSARLERIAEDPGVLAEPWERAAKRMRERPERPVWTTGLDWGAMGQWLAEGAKAVFGTVAENLSPILQDANVPARMFGPLVEAVAATEETQPDEGVVSEFLQTVSRSPDIAAKWWEFFKRDQEGQAPPALISYAVAEYVDAGVIKPEHAPYLGAFFSLAGNPVIMHAVLTRDVPALGRAFETLGKKALPQGWLQNMRAKASLVKRGIDLNSPPQVRAALSWQRGLSKAEKAFLGKRYADLTSQWAKGGYGLVPKPPGAAPVGPGGPWPSVEQSLGAPPIVRPSFISEPVKAIPADALTPAPTVPGQPAWFQPTGPVGPAAQIAGAQVIDAAAIAAEAQDAMLRTRLTQETTQAVPEAPPAVPAKPEAPEAAPAGKQPWEMTRGEIETQYPAARGTISGLAVRDHIPNQASIDASVDNPTVLPGVREVPMSLFQDAGEAPRYATPRREQAAARLAEDISRSKELNPLIVVIDAEGPYVLEGATRYDALKTLGVKSLPAMVVLDEGSLYEGAKRRVEAGRSVPPAVLAEYPGLAKTPAEPKAPAPSVQRITADADEYVAATQKAIRGTKPLPKPPEYPDDERATELRATYATAVADEAGLHMRVNGGEKGFVLNPAVAKIVEETGGEPYIVRGPKHDLMYVVADDRVVAALSRGVAGWRPRLDHDTVLGTRVTIEGTRAVIEDDSEAVDELMADLSAMDIKGLDEDIVNFYAGLPPAGTIWDTKTELVNAVLGLPPFRGLRTQSDIANMEVGALLGDVYGVLNKHDYMAARARDYWLGQSERLRNYFTRPSLLKNKLSDIWRPKTAEQAERMGVFRGREDPDAAEMSDWQREEARKLGERMDALFDKAVEAGLMEADWFHDNYFPHAIVAWSLEPGGKPMPSKQYAKYAPGWKKKQFFQHRRKFQGTIETLEREGVTHTGPGEAAVTLYPIFVKDPAIVEPMWITALGRGIAVQSLMSGLWGMPTATGYNGVVNRETLAAMPEDTRGLYKRLDVGGLARWRVMDVQAAERGQVRVVRMAEQDLYIHKELYEPLAKLANVPLDNPLPVVGKAWGALAHASKRATLFLTPVHFATLLSYALVAPSGVIPHPRQALKVMNEFGSLWERDDPELVEAITAGLSLPQLGQAETEIRRGLQETTDMKRARGVLGQAFKRFTATWVGDGLHKLYRTAKLPLDAWDFILFDRLLGASTWENYKFARDFYLTEGYERDTAVRLAVEEASTYMGALQKIMTTRKGDYWSRRGFLASSFRRANLDTFVKALSGKGYGWKFRPVQGEGGMAPPPGGPPLQREPRLVQQMQNQIARRAASKIAKGVLWAVVAADLQTLGHYVHRWSTEGKKPPVAELWDALRRNVLTGGIHVYTTRKDRSGRGLRHVNPVFRPMTEMFRWYYKGGQWAWGTVNPATRAIYNIGANLIGEGEIDPNLPRKQYAKELAKQAFRDATFYSRLPYEMGGSRIPRTFREHFLIWVGVYPSKYTPNQHLIDDMKIKKALVAADRADARLRAQKAWLEGDDARAVKLLAKEYDASAIKQIMGQFNTMSRTWWMFKQLPPKARLEHFQQLSPEEQDAFMEAVVHEMFVRAQQETERRK